MIARSAVTLAVLVVCAAGAVGQNIDVDSVLLTLIEEIEVPARTAGQLATVAIHEGQSVAEGDELALVRDVDARLEVERAKNEVAAAKIIAENDTQLRLAKSALEVAKAEFQRAETSRSKYRRSVSDTEFDKLRLRVSELSLQLEQAQHELAVAAIQRDHKQIARQIAEQKLESCRLVAPFGGTVVEIMRRRGEWIEPGEGIAKLVRMDRLRAEGFVSARLAAGDLRGRRVTLRVTPPSESSSEFAGKVVFVHPRVDPVNEQVLVWAEIDNADQQLKPGQRGAMQIHAEAARGNAPDARRGSLVGLPAPAAPAVLKRHD